MPKPKVIIAGSKYGLWTILSEEPKIKIKGGTKRVFTCLCDCGSIRSVYLDNLLSGKSSSCGCAAVKRAHDRSTIHGHSHGRKGGPTRVYTVWRNMLNRCLKPTTKKYDRYGGRGIKVIDRWLNFENFLSDMGEPPLGHSIDRIDNDGNYEPSNCRWATRQQQGANRSTTRFVKCNDGTFMPLTHFCKSRKISFYKIYEVLYGFRTEELSENTLLNALSSRQNSE